MAIRGDVCVQSVVMLISVRLTPRKPSNCVMKLLNIASAVPFLGGLIRKLLPQTSVANKIFFGNLLNYGVKDQSTLTLVGSRWN